MVNAQGHSFQMLCGFLIYRLGSGRDSFQWILSKGGNVFSSSSPIFIKSMCWSGVNNKKFLPSGKTIHQYNQQ